MHQRIRNLRQSRNMSQVELAKQLGVTKQSVSNWENDNIQPSIEMLMKLAAVFFSFYRLPARTGADRLY